jgi:hypothetical protein
MIACLCNDIKTSDIEEYRKETKKPTVEGLVEKHFKRRSCRACFEELAALLDPKT